MGKGRLPIDNAPVITNKQVFENKSVRLLWDYPVKMNDYITGFRLYRSARPEGTKQKIYEGKNPQERSFTDNSPELTNYYVLSVYDTETEKFSTGQTYAELIDSVPPVAPTGFAGKIDSLGVVRLSWQPNTDSDIHGYRVYRSNRPDFEFLLVHPAEILKTDFTDTINIKTLTKEIYYRLKAIDLRGNMSEFSKILELKRPDIIPPVAPVIQKTTAEKDGISIIFYNSSSSDVVRHHIYRKDETNTAFVLIASIDMPAMPEKTTIYLDKDIQSGDNYIYQILAEDDSGLHSVSSAPIFAKALGEKLAEQITLKAKLIENNTEKKIVLTWTINAKKKIEYILIYKAEGDTPMRLYGNSNENNFTDKNILFGKDVKYRVKVVFDDGTTSNFSKETIVKL
jgi:fibronectin type 3 domain-containing protein